MRGIHCPHYNSEMRGIPRRKDFPDMIRKTGGIGIAIENNCAVEFIDGRLYKVISSKNYARAYTVCLPQIVPRKSCARSATGYSYLSAIMGSTRMARRAGR